LQRAGEAVLLALAVLSPWPFACNDPPFEYALSAGVLLLVALWAAHAALTGRFSVRPDVVTLALAGLALWTAVQLVPLPESVVGVLSPARLRWYHTLLPAQAELLPGEAGPAPRAAFLPLTVTPAATRTFLVRLLGVLLVYAAARNWLASRESLPRLAWALVGNGVLLAVFAVGHSFSAPAGVVYWSIPVEAGSGVFGPFVCRNHYPDYVALCVGLGVGLLLPRAADKSFSLLTPRAMWLTAALGLMLVSLPFSLSRGGMLSAVAAGAAAWLLSRVGGRGRGGVGALAVAAVVAVGVVLAAWLGTASVEKRLATLTTGEAANSRLPLWRDAAKLLPDFWAAGSGAGTFVRVEPTVRNPDRQAIFVYDSAHNEYLEALLEGGVVRLALTLLLAVGVLVVVGRGYLRRRDRSIGPLLLGAWFGLAAGVLHAGADFGIHMPAVAVLTATVAGYAVAAATDAQFVPVRVRLGREGEKKRGGEEETKPDNHPTRPSAASHSLPLSSSPPLLFSLMAALAALFVAWDERERSRAEQLRVAAIRAARRTDPQSLFDARAALRPNDSAALFDAAQANIDRAVAATWQPGAGLAGCAAAFRAVPDRLPPAVVERYLYPALRYLRAARRADPLAPKPHARLGLYARYFAASEPAAVHFDRAKRLLPSDPDIWFASGRDALARGDEATAWADWHRSLALSDRHLAAILRTARRLPLAAIREKLLPGEPTILLEAANELFPDRVSQAAERRPLLEAVARGPGATPDQLVAIAAALDELQREEEAADAWRRAVALAPDRADIRDRYARWLEREERYDDALEQLAWLRQRNPNSPILRDRIDAARHGRDLQQTIHGD
jgi:O-antigen ligase/tetratricopeptide (TPR) repeat protein